MAKQNQTADFCRKWNKDWGVGIRVSIENQGHSVLNEATADLLAAVDRTRSISAAARALSISYRYAWLLIQHANEYAGEPLIETAIGGERGGGSQLTEYGRAALDVYRQIQTKLRTAAAQSLPHVLSKITSEKTVLHLAAAISLQEVVAQIVSEYAIMRPTVSVRTIFGASNELAEQIENGGLVDLFISAGKDPVDRVNKAGLIRRGSRCIVASNGLAIVTTADSPIKISKANDLKKLKDITLVVADPQCPLGRYTQQFLQSEKLTDTLKPMLRTVGNSRAVIATLNAGSAQVGIIFSSDISNATGLKVLLELPTKGVNANYEAVALSSTDNLAETQGLLDFLQSEKAINCFRRCGFVVTKK